MKKITSALISVYHKDRIEEIAAMLKDYEVKLFSTGGTYDFLTSKGFEVTTVESITGYPSIIGGRVKTLHPSVFGGILSRRHLVEDTRQLEQYNIPEIDLVIVDLYPFEQTLLETDKDEEIIEKIDIGGISLIRAAAKNYADVIIVPSMDHYEDLISLLKEKNGYSDLPDRRKFATWAFDVSSHYDTAIYGYFSKDSLPAVFKKSIRKGRSLRYGENPHQSAMFFGDLNVIFEQLHGKEISYNNLCDLEAGIQLVNEFEEPVFAILKHQNPCGIASRDNLTECWKAALAGDPVSAFGGILLTNHEIDEPTAAEINHLFFEVLLSPGFEKNAYEILASKKNRIILQKNSCDLPLKQFRSLLNGVIIQDRDIARAKPGDLKVVTVRQPDKGQLDDLLFANLVVKHTKSNAIVLVKNRQLIGSGSGQTSRVDATKQAIAKAREFGFDLQGAVLASDAFFPFADSAGLAFEAGITALIQPGGSVRDQETVDFCNNHNMAMVVTGTRHFKH